MTVRTVTDFIKMLDNNFTENIDFELVDYENKKEYLGNVIFDFITYDSDMDIMFAEKMLEVLKALVNRKTFNYIEQSEENYINYLTMLNTPFLRDKVNWGTSIRGAWLEDTKEYTLDCGRIVIKEKELTNFITALIEWVR